MSEQSVDQICFDFLGRLPIVVQAKEVDVSSDAGILPLRGGEGGHPPISLRCVKPKNSR